jgi:hypothetical protein
MRSLARSLQGERACPPAAGLTPIIGVRALSAGSTRAESPPEAMGFDLSLQAAASGERLTGLLAPSILKSMEVATMPGTQWHHR